MPQPQTDPWSQIPELDPVPATGAVAAPGAEPPSSCAAPDAQPPRKSRRAYERQRVGKSVTVTELDQFGCPGATWSCVTSDISRGGIGLRSPRLVFLGCGLVMQMLSGPDQMRRAFFGLVRQLRYVPGKGYVVGLQFEPMPRTPELRAWLRGNGLSRD